MLLFGDHRNKSRNPDAIGTHCQPYRLAILAENVDGECVGVLATELEDVADLDSARAHQRTGAIRRRVAIANLGGLDDSIGSEVTARNQTHHMLASFVSTGDPRGTRRHPRINQVANTVVQQCLRADVALLQEGVLREVGVIDHGVFGRVECGAEAFVVYLTVTGQPDSEQFPLPTRCANLEQHILECVGGGDGAAQAGGVRPVDQGCDGWSISGVVHRRRRHRIDRHRVGYRCGDRLDVGGVAGFQTPHEGVLTDFTLGQELLRCAAAHRSGDRRNDERMFMRANIF